MDNIQKLQESKNINEANSILHDLKANGAIKKLVETSFLTRQSTDEQTQKFGMSCLKEAITSLREGVKIQEEELQANSKGNAGSEQSTENTAPYTAPGKETGDEDATNAPDTENQMKELEGTSDDPLKILESNGLHPDIAKSMGDKMPKIPPMNSGDQVKQMKYTVAEAIKPLIKHMKVQDNVIRKLSQQIRETKTMRLNFEDNNTPMTSMQETLGNQNGLQLQQKTHNPGFDLSERRNRIYQLNDALAQQSR